MSTVQVLKHYFFNMVTSSSTGQAIASASLSSELSVGTILWIKELVESDRSERYGLPPVCFKHPCVVVDLSASRKGFVQVYVVCPSPASLQSS